jgi:hypothetical protein
VLFGNIMPDIPANIISNLALARDRNCSCSESLRIALSKTSGSELLDKETGGKQVGQDRDRVLHRCVMRFVGHDVTSIAATTPASASSRVGKLPMMALPNSRL